MRSIYLKDVSKKRVLGYVLLPGILPRIQELFGGGFGYVAFLMAQIYNMVRLLPDDHAYMNPQNIGEFSVRSVIAEAANHLVIKKENIDQILIFFALLAGTVLLLLQLVILAYTMLIEPAMAAGATPPTAFSLFTTPDASTGKVSVDIAFTLLDRVFGIPDFFCSIGNQCTKILSGGPTPFHKGMQSLFQFYSLGMLLVGVLIFLYFMGVVVVETAVSGTPFGQRFQNVWVPIRLVVALGLLTPLNYGYSSGQYIAFYAAKAGSGLATNGWNMYNNAIAGGGNANPTGEQETLIPYPSPQTIAPIIQAMTIVHSCAYAYHRAHNSDWSPPPSPDAYIKAYLVKGASIIAAGSTDTFKLLSGVDYDAALEFYNDSDIVIRFGIQDEDKYPQHKGNVEPTCGDIRIKKHSNPTSYTDGFGRVRKVNPQGAISKKYFTMIKNLWENEEELTDFAQRMMEIKVKRHINNDNYPCLFAAANPHFHLEEPACYTKNPKATWRSELIKDYQTQINVEITSQWQNYAKAAPFKLEDDVKDRGWGGAGIWYNKIAQLNGEFITAVMDVPTMSKYPLVMEQVRKSNRASNNASSSTSQFEPRTANSGAGEYYTVTLPSGRTGLDIASALSEVHSYWNTDGGGDIDQDNVRSPNFLLNMANLLMGTQGLFDMRNNSRAHPLSQLVALGKGLVEAGVRNMAVSSTTAFLGGVAGAFKGQSGSAAMLSALSSMFKSTAFLAITAGFILFYIVPFLPFIYTFFAVGGWIKTIFEAMVGIPLWALAHLRIDGEGLPGDSAQNGYFLILEIFLRPILTIFGLIAAITIFTAQVRLLNAIWDIVLVNLGGFNDAIDITKDLSSGTGSIGISFRRSSVDQLFFTILYAIVVYMMATGSFKLIDRIPQNILRWSGNGVSAFGDINEDAKGLERYAAIGGITIGRQVVDGVEKAASGLGGALGQGLKRATTNTDTPPISPQTRRGV